MWAVTPISTGRCRIRAAPSRASTARFVFATAATGCTTFRPTAPTSTARNTASTRPICLRDGDRLSIGPYIIAVEVEGQSGAQPGAAAAVAVAGAANADVWGEVGEAAAPDDRSAYQTAGRSEPRPDFLDTASFIAPAETPGFSPPPTAADDWLTAAPVRRAAAAGADRSRRNCVVRPSRPRPSRQGR